MSNPGHGWFPPRHAKIKIKTDRKKNSEIRDTRKNERKSFFSYPSSSSSFLSGGGERKRCLEREIFFGWEIARARTKKRKILLVFAKPGSWLTAEAKGWVQKRLYFFCGRRYDFVHASLWGGIWDGAWSLLITWNPAKSKRKKGISPSFKYFSPFSFPWRIETITLLFPGGRRRRRWGGKKSSFFTRCLTHSVFPGKIPPLSL